MNKSTHQEESPVTNTIASASVKLGLCSIKPVNVTDELFAQVARMYYEQFGTLPESWRTYMERTLESKKK